MTNEEESDAVWDAWIEARRRDPLLTPDAFASRWTGDRAVVFEHLRTLLALEGELGPAPLVDPTLDRDGLFAGFRIERRLGQGGSGIVFLARDERPRAARRPGPVALKVLNPLLAPTAERRESILREAELGLRLDHPNIVSVLDAGVERGYAWIATRYVAGRTLGDAIDEGLSREQTLRIGLDIATALAHAHERGIVHRDLKPANVVVDADERAHVLDFGLAQAEGTAFSVTLSGEVIGTLRYMAPEQVRSQRDVGPATDLYALGLILLECVAGREPLPEGEVMRQLGDAAKGRRRAGPRLKRLPASLRTIVLRCLEPHPADRYPSAKAVRDDLERILEGRGPNLDRLSVSRRFLRRAKRHPTRAIAASTGIVALILFMAALYLTWPVRLTIDSFRSAKRLFVDGEELGVTPTRARLRPGEHTYRLVRGNGEEGYEGTFHVDRDSRNLFLAHDPPDGAEPVEGTTWSPSHAWLQIAVPHPRMRLTLDGVPYNDVEGSSAVPVLPGMHVARVEVEGTRPVERTFEVRSTELHTLLVEPDPVDSPWTTLTLYSPLDVQVQDALVQLDRLRLYVEDREVIDNLDRREVHKVYWTPTRAYEDGSALMRFELHVEPGEIEIVWNRFMAVTGTEGDESEPWTKLEMGPSPDALVELRPESYDGDEHPRGRWPARIQAEDLSKLERLMSRTHTLFVRVSAGNAPASEARAYTTALRSNGLPLPERDGEQAVWIPALTIRVRSR